MRGGRQMIWLSGQIEIVLTAPRRPDLGVMLRASRRSDPMPPPGMPWAIDNECFTRGDQFDERVWLEGLEWFSSRSRWCLFAVAPDVVGDAVGTLVRSKPYLDEIAAFGYVPAFVTQDGCRSDLIPWNDIGALFVGGSNAWKLCDQSLTLIREARDRGLWTHMGRCQARGRIGGRIAAAHALGMNSGDGTVLARDPSRLGRVQRGLEALNAQLAMEAIS